ncbi:putative sugar phosphate/phosphate translocator [Platanthera zijinensis]|uniref:Sugar phosphate/phosphate translocator n=1 Tax=Platanthera zijinensis TaxID=2320716 RepID=A0AAP0AXU3_9ASPA
MYSAGPWNFPPVILLLNCLCTFALNLSVYLVISRTSALTIRVARVVRDWVVVLFSSVIFSDKELIVINGVWRASSNLSGFPTFGPNFSTDITVILNFFPKKILVGS